MSRTLRTSSIQRDVSHAHGHSGSNQKSTVAWALVSALVATLDSALVSALVVIEHGLPYVGVQL
jgi:hypothetical protein